MSNQPNSKTLQAPSLDWNDEGQPLSKQYDDYYFNTESGLEETLFTFIRPNQLEARFSKLEDKETVVFNIFETGFGTGLSFLCTKTLWKEKAPKNARLHFISVENHPLSKQQLEQALKLWPQFKSDAQALLAKYPIATKGFHLLEFEQDNVSLTLLFGNADEQLPLLEGAIDAWFLDGFTPSKNPDMWSPTLFSNMARLSHSHTSFATFTAASMIRKQLIGAGFSVNKISGFGKKRHILNGSFKQSQGPVSPRIHNKPWLLPQNNNSDTVVIIGAGLAGCTSAYSLAKRGRKVILLEQHACVAQEASGNAQGVLYAKLAADNNSKHSDFYLQGYMFTLDLLNHTLEKGADKHWNSCGVLQLAYNDKEQKRQDSFFAQQQYPESLLRATTAEQASKIAGVPISNGGVFFPEGGWVHPPALCTKLSQHKNIDHQFHTKALKLKQVDNGWQVFDTDQKLIAEAGSVIVACANHSNQFEQLSWLPTKAIRGQVSHLHKPEKAGLLKTVLCGKGYISPDKDGHFSFGATFNLKDSSQEINPEHHLDNQKMLRGNFPDLANQLFEDSDKLSGRVSFRCTTPDYLPLVGPVLDMETFKEEFSLLRKNADWPFAKDAPFLKGLYINLGHGSRGLVSAPLCSEILAAEICQEVISAPQQNRYILSPARFLVRNMIRKKA